MQLAMFQALYNCFPGKRLNINTPLKKTRETAENAPFCILRVTQIPFVARLVALLDQGHDGLLDRFLITFPKCLRPTQTSQSRAFQRPRHIH